MDKNQINNMNYTTSVAFNKTPILSVGQKSDRGLSGLGSRSQQGCASS